MKDIDKIKDEAIKKIDDQMKLNARMYESGEYTYEELHWVQNECIKKKEDLIQLAELIKSGKIKDMKDYEALYSKI